MLKRQKTVLMLLKQASRPVQRVELMKWCFLLRVDSASKGSSAFYDFVPYKKGPFSFSLYQEIKRLVELNYVIAHGESAWSLNPELAHAASGAGPAVERDVRILIKNFNYLTTDELLDYVYKRHPAYTVNSEVQQLAPRPTADPAVYTAGYERLSVDGFLNLLIERGIQRVIDVRSNPISRRYGFHKTTLTRLTQRLDLEYRHFPQLGIEAEKRQYFPANRERTVLFDEYEATTLVNEPDSILDVACLVAEKPSVLVCIEADPKSCHRSRLATPVAEVTGLPIIHL
jgi:uncharacterized protein (DUF488 family)